jgi:uncharacterized protein (DUF433 family)
VLGNVSFDRLWLLSPPLLMRDVRVYPQMFGLRHETRAIPVPTCLPRAGSVFGNWRSTDRLMVVSSSMERESVITSDPEILGGTPCFRGTRVPVDSLIDYLEAGDTLDEFLDNFPSVSRDAAIAALEEAKTLLTSPR